jgi:hypothetical protein
VPLGVEFLDIFACFLVELEAGDFAGLLVDDFESGVSSCVYTKGRYSPLFLGTI